MFGGYFIFHLLNTDWDVLVEVRVVVQRSLGFCDLLSFDEVLLSPHRSVKGAVRLVNTLGLAYLEAFESRWFVVFRRRALQLVVFRTLVDGD